MAQAWVRFVSTAGYGGTTPQSFFFEVTFFGADVPQAIAKGQQLEVSAGLVSPLTLPALTATVLTAVQTRATALGLTVASRDIFLDSYAVGAFDLGVWFDASTITGLVDGDPVGTWPDLSGHGYDATQGTAAKKPTYKTNILNGHPVVRFDGVDDVLLLPSGARGIFQNVTGGTMVAVVKSTSAAIGPRDVMAWSINTPSTEERASLECCRTIGQWGTSGRRTDAESVTNGTGGTVSTMAFTILAALFDWGSSHNQYLYQDGIQVAAGALGLTSGATSNTVSLSATLGALDSANWFHQGDLAELYAIPRMLASDELNSLTSSLGTKYAISV